MLPLVSRGAYEFAVSSTCMVFFLIELVLALIVFIDASKRGLPALAWAFIAFIPYVGFPIYLIYIVATGQTSFHIRRNPVSEEVKKRWVDTPSSVASDKPLIHEMDDQGLSPYRRK